MGRLITKGQLGLHLGRYLEKQRNKVPMKPTWSKVRGTNTQQCELSEQLLEHLERLSLVNFSNKEAIDRLSKAISFANEMKFIDTTGIEPMDSVLESRTLFLRDDVVTEGNCREAIMQNATRKIEEYFVAPPGNIPIIPTVSEVNRSTLPELEGKKLK